MVLTKNKHRAPGLERDFRKFRMQAPQMEKAMSNPSKSQRDKLVRRMAVTRRGYQIPLGMVAMLLAYLGGIYSGRAGVSYLVVAAAIATITLLAILAATAATAHDNYKHALDDLDRPADSPDNNPQLEQ